MAHTSDTGLIRRAREFMEKFAAAKAGRSSKRQSWADDVGENQAEAPRPLGAFNPMVVAVSLYTTPRRNG
jgi:hypothetical protein